MKRHRLPADELLEHRPDAVATSWRTARHAIPAIQLECELRFIIETCARTTKNMRGRPRLEAALRVVKPKMLVCLGATAAQTIFGPSFRVTRERGKVLSSKFAAKVVATVHPSSLLRQPDKESREREYKNFVADLRVALKAAGEK